MTNDKPKKKPFPESKPFEETVFPESTPFQKTSFEKNAPSYVPADQVSEKEAIPVVLPDKKKEASTKAANLKELKEADVNVLEDQVPEEVAISVIFPDNGPKNNPASAPLPLAPAVAPGEEEIYIIPEIVEELPTGQTEKADAVIIDPRTPLERGAKPPRRGPRVGPPPGRQ